MKMKKLLSGLLAVCMLLTLLPVAAFAQEPADVSGGYTARQIENPGVDLKQNLSKANFPLVEQAGRDENEVVSAIVSLKGDGLLAQGYSIEEVAQLSSAVADETADMKAQQDRVLSEISALVRGTLGQAELMGVSEDEDLVPEFRYTAGLNGFAVDVPYGLLDDIQALDGVESVHEACVFSVPEDMSQKGDQPYMYKTQEIFGTAQTWTDLGYTGQGMRIAIIDTGLDMDHPSFAAAPAEPSMTADSLTQEQVENLTAYEAFSQTSAVRLTPDKLYRTAKVPYGFNYADKSLDVTHDNDSQGDHGTHVAGIAAANALPDVTDVVGVAPDAQILVMKVFGRGEGGAGEGAVLAAVEDAIKLDVDVMNLSLGSPAGYTMESQTIERVYRQILNHGMIAAIAAGNSYSAAYGNGYLGTDLNEARDPDNGVVSSPGTYTGATMVASMDNLTEKLPYLTAGEDTKIAYNCGSTPKLDTLAGAPMEYVMIPGYGRSEDYNGINVSGKVAVVQRGGGEDINFYVKLTNAYRAGAAACLVYDNVEGPYINMIQTDESNNPVKIPNGFITKAHGAKLAELAGEDGVGTLTFAPEGELEEFALYTAGEMSDFSSWGVTPDLQLAPDVTAPGGQIYSTVDHGQYDTYGGTSMASPHIAGMAAIVLEYLSDKYPELDNDPAQKHLVAEALIMSTAVPGVDLNGVLYSPRKQGAGYANVYSAVTSPAYLTSHQATTNEETPKASLGDDPEKTGEYTFSFTIHNMGDTPLTYSLDASLLTDQVTTIDGLDGMTFMSETGRNLSGKVTFQTIASLSPAYDVNGDGVSDLQDVQALLDHVNGVSLLEEAVAARFDLTADGKLDTADAQVIFEAISAGAADVQQVTVPAKGGITVKASVLLSQEDKTYMDKNYENGIYVDGFVRCLATSEDAKDLSLPFVGFYGDWSDGRIFDEGFMHFDDLSTEGVLECPYQRYPNSFYVSVGDSGVWELGVNPYVTEDYDPEHNVLSPNGDTYLDSFYDIYLGLMRSSMVTTFTWTDSEGNELFHEWFNFARKSFYLVNYGVCYPMQYSEQCKNFDFNAAVTDGTLANGDHVTLTIRGYLNDGEIAPTQVGSLARPDPNFADDVMTIPVVIDTEAPVITNVDDLGFSEEDGRTYLTIQVSDNYDIAAVVPMTLGGEAYEYIHVDTKAKGVDGEKDTIKLDVTDYDGTFQIALCDYGMNETYYEITNQAPAKLDAGKFYGYRRYASFVENGVSYATDQYNGWHSFEKATKLTMHTNQAQSEEAAVAAAEYVDGYVIGIDVNSTIFAMKAGDWKRIELGTLEVWGDIYSALDMTYDYTTNTFYILTDELENPWYDPDPDLADDPDNLPILPASLLQMTIEDGYPMVDMVGSLNADSGVDTERSQLLTLACDNAGSIYSIDYDTGALCTVSVGEYDEDNAVYDLNVTPVRGRDSNGKMIGTGYNPARYSQSMTVDHETDKLYWAAYQGSVGRSFFFELDKVKGIFKQDTSTSMEMNSEMTGLFKPFTPETPIFDKTVEAEPVMNRETILLKPGQSATLSYYAMPFYGALSNEVTWSLMDPATFDPLDASPVAKVNQLGMVTALGEGTVMVVATVGDYEAYCTVNVADVSGTLLTYDNGEDGYSSTAQSWLMMNADDPAHALQVTDGAGEGIVAAAYQGGGVFAIGCVENVEIVTDEEGYEEEIVTQSYTFYRLDGALQEEYSFPLTAFGTNEDEGTTTAPLAMSFDYTTGNLYVLVSSGSWRSSEYKLVSLDPITGNITEVAPVLGGAGGGGLYAQVAGPLEELAAEMPLGDEAPAEAMTAEDGGAGDEAAPEAAPLPGLYDVRAMAMDYEGNFYFLGYSDDDSDDAVYYVLLTKARLAVQDDATVLETTETYFWPLEYSEVVTARNPDNTLVWSEANGSLFLGSQDHLYWVALPAASGEVVKVVDVDAVAQEDYGANQGLMAVIDPANEPEMPEILPESVVAAQGTYTVVEGLTTQVKLNPTPWNATCEATYQIADRSIATVDANGVITGVKEGRTTLNITVQGRDGDIDVAPVQVVVTPDMGSVFGFVTNTYSSQGTLPADSWARIPLSNPKGVSFISSYLGSYSIYAGAYNGKDGCVYAYGQSDADYGYYMLKIDPNGYTYSILSQQDYLVRDMAFDYTTGTLFAVAQDQAIAGGLFQVNTKTGEMTLVADLGEEIATVAVDDEGILYVITAAGKLCTVDGSSETGALTKLSDLDVYVGPLYQSMTYDYNNDKLYWTHDSGYEGNLYMIDKDDPDYTLTPLGVLDTGDGDGTMAGSVAVTTLYSAPETEVAIPETVDPAGVRVPEKTYVVVGETTALNATVLPVSVAKVDQTVTWESSDTSKATVDANGVVTGLAAGSVTITAKVTTESGEFTDSCAVEVLATARSFYGYDQLAASWVRFDDAGKATVVKAEGQDVSPISAATYDYVTKTLYAYDADGYFYTVDTETFERSEAKSGVHGVTVPLTGISQWKGEQHTKNAAFTVADMTFDPDSHDLFALLIADYDTPYYRDTCAKIVKVDPATGEIAEELMTNSTTSADGTILPANLLFYNGKLYFVDGFTTGQLTSVDLETKVVTPYAIFAEYWGEYVGGRSMIVDEYTGKIYAVRDMLTQFYDMTRSKSTLCEIGLGNANATVLHDLGQDTIITSLFIK